MREDVSSSSHQEVAPSGRSRDVKPSDTDLPRVTYLPSELDPPPQEQQQREVDSSPSAPSRHQSTTPCKRQQPIGLSISPRQLSLFQWWISYNFKISWRTLTPGSSHKLTRITHFLAIIVFSNTIWLTQESIKKKKKKERWPQKTVIYHHFKGFLSLIVLK